MSTAQFYQHNFEVKNQETVGSTTLQGFHVFFVYMEGKTEANCPQALLQYLPVISNPPMADLIFCLL